MIECVLHARRPRGCPEMLRGGREDGPGCSASGAKCKSHSTGLVLGFLEFRGGIGVGDNPGADVIVEVAALVNEGADGDVEL